MADAVSADQSSMGPPAETAAVECDRMLEEHFTTMCCTVTSAAVVPDVSMLTQHPEELMATTAS